MNKEFLLKTSVENLSTGVVIADCDHKIIYLNTSAKTLFRNAEAEIREKLPDFYADNLIGMEINQFHHNPEYQKKLLSRFTDTVEASFVFGRFEFEIKARPIIDSFGERLGTMSEWRCITEKEKNADRLIITNRNLLAKRYEAETNLIELNFLYKKLANTYKALVFQNTKCEPELSELANKLQESDAKNTLLNNRLTYLQNLESVGEMVFSFAHDFNHILGCILGYSQLNQHLSDYISDAGLKIELNTNTNQVNLAVNRAAVLINKMLTYCHQDKHKKNINIQPTKTVIKEVLIMLRSKLIEKIKLRMVLECNEIIRMDAIDLHQILMYLAFNARDAMNEQAGTIIFSLKKVRNVNASCLACAAIMDGDFIELGVSDNGVGIEPKIMNHLFDPFFTTKPQDESVGFTLSKVNVLVHQSHGHILVDSNQNKINHGAAFRLLFPN